MLLFKNKTKTTYEIKINNKKNNILRNTAIAMVFSLVGLSFFAGMKVYNIENIISHNKAIIASISDDKDATNILFSQEYTDEMFQKDLKNFEVMNNQLQKYKEGVGYHE